jgi:LPXTG-site transpeptidase (sortase) family protein
MSRRRAILLATSVVVLVIGAMIAVLAPRDHKPPSLPVAAPSAVPSASALTPPKVAAAISRSTPVRVVIPSIGVNAPIIPEGVDSSGALEVPPLTGPQSYDAGWWDGGAAPGQDGPAVIVGHINSAAMGNLVFANLDEMKAGEAVEVELADGADVWFSVVGTQEVSKTAFPTQAVYGQTPWPTLRLITCGGAFDSATGHYVDNFIVYANENVGS